MEPMGILVGLIIGAIVASGLVYLLCDRRYRNASGAIVAASQIAESKIAYGLERIASLESRMAVLQNEKSAAESGRASAIAQLEAERAKVIEQTRFINGSEERMREAFRSMSLESLQKGGEQFLALASERFKELTNTAATSLEQKKLEMTSMLQPMSQTLAQYKESLEKMEATRAEAFTSISAKLAEVANTQILLGTVTTQLSGALRRSEVRGQWGEMTLRRLFEMSGLANHIAFSEQVTSSTEENGKQRPDVVVRLPNEREVLIDCKAVLQAFLDATQCVDDVSRSECYKRHARQIRSRVDELSRKSYWSAFGASADYVVLFLPGEAFLYAAVEHDPELIEYALSSKVIIASPTTLLGLLKVIEFGWEKKNVEANAERIRVLGVELHDRVATLSTHFQKLGVALERAMESYNSTLGSIETRVFTTVRKIAELGASGDSTIDSFDPLSMRARELGSAWRQLPQNDLEGAAEQGDQVQ